MALYLSFGQILPVSFSVTLALSLAIVSAPARADHFPTHPAAGPTAVAPSAAELAAQVHRAQDANG